MTLVRTLELEPEIGTREDMEQRWRSALHHRLVSLDLRVTDETAPPGAFHERDLGDLRLTEWQCPPVEAVRPGRMAQEDDDTLILMTAQAGEMGVVLSDRTEHLRPGAVMLMRSRVSGRISVPGWLTKRSVRIPMPALTPFEISNRVPDVLTIEAADSSLTWLLLDFLSGIDRQHKLLDATAAEATRNALLSLVAGIIRTSQASATRAGDFLPMLRQQMEKWIAEHLTDGVVRVHDLAAAYNVAPRTVHRAFAATGDTLGSVVRAHRISAVRNDLVHSTLSIAAIAYRWGFCDASHLGREFRRAMSMSPGDYREAFRVA